MKKSVGLLACAAALVAGCGTVSGQAEPAGSSITEPAFSPCDDIPDEAIRAVGFDPATEGRDVSGVKQPGWNMCNWQNGRRILRVQSNTYSLDDVRKNPDYRDFRDVDISGQPGLEFGHVTEAPEVLCYAVTDTSGGLMMVVATIRSNDGDPCELAHSAAVEFLPYADK
ncbi:DUF3558 domain-containing protein [Rhodococcus gannanensis]|uniref:DUF3558 domain-containing protein n=1 Tax=Rhodococcus gannanensis TaxID=1960308 RepID=A0ABW4P8A2_9NOCA